MVFSWVPVHLHPDRELLARRTRLLPCGCRAQSGCPEPEAGRMIQYSPARSPLMMLEPDTSPHPRHCNCDRDSIRCSGVRGTRSQLWHRAGRRSINTVNADPAVGSGRRPGRFACVPRTLGTHRTRRPPGPCSSSRPWAPPPRPRIGPSRS